MTRNEESVETDIEFTVKLKTLVISAMCIVSIVLLRINMNGIKKPNKTGIKQIEKYNIDFNLDEWFLIFNCVFLL